MDIEAIKIDLTTSGLTQKQIAEKHGATPFFINRINTGAVHADVEPKTESQKTREKYKDKYNGSTLSKHWPPYNIKQDIMKLQLRDQEDFDKLLKHVIEKPGWPKVIYIDSSDKESLEWARGFLIDSQRKLEVKLSKVRLMIDAIERNDYSDLPPSCLKELTEEINKSRAAQEETQPPQQWESKP